MRLATRTLPFALLLIAVLIGLRLVTRPGPNRAISAGARSVELEEDTRPEIARLETPESQGVPERGEPEPDSVRTAVAQPVSEPEPEPAPHAAPEAEVQLAAAGRLVTLDALGNEIDLVADGQLTLTFWDGNSGSGLYVPIRDGSFRAEIVEDNGRVRLAAPDGATLSLFDPESLGGSLSIGTVEVQVDGRMAVVTDRNLRFAFGTEDLVVRVHFPESMRLVVEDADTGIGLDRVDVLEAGSWRVSSFGHPGDPDAVDSSPFGGDRPATPRVIRGEPSPVILVPDAQVARRGRMKYFVGHEGYAWKPLELEFTTGGERRVRLERAGAAELTLTGEQPPEGATLRLRQVDHPIEGQGQGPYASVAPEAEGPTRIEALLPGSYVARLEVGDWYDSPLVLAEAPFEVRAGETSYVQLLVEPAPTWDEAPLAGRLILPAEWELDGFWISFELLDTPLDGGDGRHTVFHRELRRTAPDELSWTVGKVQTGRYRMTLSKLEYSILLDVGPEGLTDAEMVVPPPVEVFVHVRDETTGGPAEVEQIHWYCKRPGDSMGGGLESATRASGEPHFLLRVPRTTITVSTWSREYSRASSEFEALDGLEVTLDVRPATSGVVLLRDGDSRVPWPSAYWPEVEALDGEGQRRSMGGHSTGFWFSVSEPGRYRIPLPEIDGFASQDPIEVELIEGRQTEFEVQLERLP